MLCHEQIIGKCYLSDHRKQLIQLIRAVTHMQEWAKYEWRSYTEFFPNNILTAPWYTDNCSVNKYTPFFLICLWVVPTHTYGRVEGIWFVQVICLTSPQTAKSTKCHLTDSNSTISHTTDKQVSRAWCCTPRKLFVCYQILHLTIQGHSRSISAHIESSYMISYKWLLWTKLYLAPSLK